MISLVMMHLGKVGKAERKDLGILLEAFLIFLKNFLEEASDKIQDKEGLQGEVIYVTI
jgi:hypothetical protein